MHQMHLQCCRSDFNKSRLRGELRGLNSYRHAVCHAEYKEQDKGNGQHIGGKSGGVSVLGLGKDEGSAAKSRFCYTTVPWSQIPLCVIDFYSPKCSTDRLPEAGFRRHAPRQREGSCWHRWKAGLMWNALSLMGRYISLSGRGSISAITQPCCTATASRATCEGMQRNIVSDLVLDFSSLNSLLF